MVRISGGLSCGRRLHIPPEGWIRPTMGRVREAMFSMLGRHLPGAQVLDLFAGCGLLGLEAISRGACATFFVDLEWKAVHCIEKNVTLCGVQANSTILQGNLLHNHTLSKVKLLADQKLAKQRPDGGARFDLVFLDPPYRKGLLAGTLRHMEQAELLAPGAIIVVEQEAEAEPDPFADWTMLQNRRYGDTRVIFWQEPTQAAMESSSLS
ncbi:MAG: 16S rRNA (guanine(966)-N(2))-methyltransferase RsmD [Magnetococcus sp. XQGC-1]